MQTICLRFAKPVPKLGRGDGHFEQRGRPVDQRRNRYERCEVQLGTAKKGDQIRSENGE